MSIQSILQSIQQYETVIIHRHVRPDPDALGSQSGLAHMIKDTYVDKKVYVVGEEDERLTFLAQMDDVTEEMYANALVIVCDTANQARISDQRYSLGAALIKLDHHPDVDDYGDIQWVNTNASSTSEMVYELYEASKEYGYNYVMSAQVARLLYAGIVGDTGRFLFPSSTARTLQIAADLATYDFDRTALYDGMYKTSPAIARLKGYILQNFTISSAGVSTVKLTKETLEQFHVTPSQTSAVVGLLGEVEGMLTWAIFVEEDEQIRVRLRSKGPAIHNVAAKYNGGGHPRASGATVYSKEEMEQLVADLEQVTIDYVRK
ncbi:DHH family phosphoesterase [Pontibacillus litoralis]|uniref:Oligoribonuclease n=1 Tax=Pontibacillus litoralis JSM 072002 TaxID=1385512 RepID=A0A0A5G7J3_9BACI|nr:bifunctional oligoribonuclease/PAP phosphatase NrnA [Pontibacillus litoralis]KGX89106.1 oligoribonuclease [Pontibacillus litoralis JSM 072002]